MGTVYLATLNLNQSTCFWHSMVLQDPLVASKVRYSANYLKDTTMGDCHRRLSFTYLTMLSKSIVLL
jgi:hypothetical protein